VTVLVDGRWIFPASRGMGRFAHMMIEPLIKAKSLTVLSPNLGLHADGCSIISHPARPYPVWEQFVLRGKARETSPDFVFCPYNTAPLCWSESARLVIAVHDLIYLKSIQELPLSGSPYQSLGRFYRKFVVPRVIKNAFRIVTVSQTTKINLISELHISDSQIVVIPNALSTEWFAPSPVLSKRDSSIYLAVTGDAPHKNCSALIRAFAVASQRMSRAKLWIVGIPEVRHARWNDFAKRCGVSDGVEFFDQLTTPELIRLYDQAGSMIFPSLIEGFGIPLIEAMARNLPIAASARPFVSEVAGDAALLFDPNDVDAIVSAIIRIGEDGELRNRLVENAKCRAGLFSHGAVVPLVSRFWTDIGAL